MLQFSNDLKTALLTSMGLRDILRYGHIYVFAGAVPPNADAPLDMVTLHTQIADIFYDRSGSLDGMDFETVVNGQLRKKDSEVWSATATFDGAGSGQGQLTATFFRACGTGDTGRTDGLGGGTQYRIQGTVGLALSNADLKFGVVEYAPSDTVTVADFRLNLFGA